MRDPDMLHKSYELMVPEGIIKIDAVPEYSVFDYDLADDKDYNKFIADVEKDVRNSFEYKQMINYLRNYADMNQCAFFKNVSNANSTKVGIEIHHDPLGLYDITLIVIRKRMDLHESMEIEDVSREIMYLHYKMMVGLIPLSRTVHELVHNQYLFIPTTAVYGKYKEFINRYHDWMLPEQLDNIERIERYTAECDSDDYKDVLTRHYIYTDVEGFKPHTNEEMLNLVKNRIGEVLKP